MDVEGQQNRNDPAFGRFERGEAPGELAEESDTPKALTEPDPKTTQLMEQVVQKTNLRKALKRVRANRGSPGVDGMSVDELVPHLREHWKGLKKKLLDGSYEPSAVRRVEIPKRSGGVRTLGIPTVLDRFIQQAILQVLTPLFDPRFSQHSYDFRPGKSAHQAVEAARAHIQEGYGWVVDVDKPQKRKFLGFSFFIRDGRVKIRIAPESIRRIRERIRWTTRRSRGMALERVIAELNRFTVGWIGYFQITEAASVLKATDEWTRRRLRCFRIKQWRNRPHTRFREMRALGLSKDHAAMFASIRRGWWVLSLTPQASLAFPESYFVERGLIGLLRRYAELKSVRTAGCGPACPVV